MSSTLSNFTLETKFHLKRKRKHHIMLDVMNIKADTLSQSCCSPEAADQKSQDLCVHDFLF